MKIKYIYPDDLRLTEYDERWVVFCRRMLGLPEGAELPRMNYLAVVVVELPD